MKKEEGKGQRDMLHKSRAALPHQLCGEVVLPVA